MMEEPVGMEEQPGTSTTQRRYSSIYGDYVDPGYDHRVLPERAPPKTHKERRRLLKAIRYVHTFKSYNVKLLCDIVDFMFPMKVKANDVIYTEQDRETHFYVIEDGVFDVIVDGKLVNEYKGSGCFGELALFHEDKCLATIQAHTDGKLWMLRGETLRRHLARAVNARLLWCEEMIQTVPVLQMLTKKEVEKLARALEPRKFTSGEVICQQDEEADGLYLVEDGELDVMIKKGKVTRRIATLSRGGYFGDLSLVSKRPVGATIIATGAVNCAFISVSMFELVVDNCINVMMRNGDNFSSDIIAAFGSREAVSDLRHDNLWAHLTNQDPWEPLEGDLVGDSGDSLIDFPDEEVEDPSSMKETSFELTTADLPTTSADVSLGEMSMRSDGSSGSSGTSYSSDLPVLPGPPSAGTPSADTPGPSCSKEDDDEQMCF